MLNMCSINQKSISAFFPSDFQKTQSQCMRVYSAVLTTASDSAIHLLDDAFIRHDQAVVENGGAMLTKYNPLSLVHKAKGYRSVTRRFRQLLKIIQSPTGSLLFNISNDSQTFFKKSFLERNCSRFVRRQRN